MEVKTVKTVKKINGWGDLKFWESEDWIKIQEELSVQEDYLPQKEHIFTALVSTPLSKVRVVILGQDPYPSIGTATGLAFSIQPFVRVYPPTLINIFKEYKTDLGYRDPPNGSLLKWAEQGVLLLNTHLTVRPGQPNSHRLLGWDILVKQILEAVLEYNSDAVFILWGKFARETIGEMNIKPKNIIISVHPSPQAADRGFFGSRPFTRTNAMLSQSKQPLIDWRL